MCGTAAADVVASSLGKAAAANGKRNFPRRFYRISATMARRWWTCSGGRHRRALSTNGRCPSPPHFKPPPASMRALCLGLYTVRRSMVWQSIKATPTERGQRDDVGERRRNKSAQMRGPTTSCKQCDRIASEERAHRPIGGLTNGRTDEWDAGAWPCRHMTTISF